MKHLKYFENGNFMADNNGYKKDIQIVKDVFQDLIDDWDLELVDSYGDIRVGNYFIIKYVEAVYIGREHSITINILKSNKIGGWSNVSNSVEFNRYIEDHINKLRSMGYSVVDVGGRKCHSLQIILTPGWG